MPIIPFRIEDVPPSKSMEYFISSPHWLDALTPPLEKHLNQLAGTVSLLLTRTSSGTDRAQDRSAGEQPPPPRAATPDKAEPDEQVSPRREPAPEIEEKRPVGAAYTSKLRTLLPSMTLFMALVVVLFLWWFAHSRLPENQRLSRVVAPDRRLAVAITPFYGPDEDSAKEGRVMAALVEKAINDRLGADVKVIGLEETREPVHSHEAARALGERIGAAVVIWGEAFALRNETEIQPYFTMVRQQRRSPLVESERRVTTADLFTTV